MRVVNIGYSRRLSKALKAMPRVCIDIKKELTAWLSLFAVEGHSKQGGVHAGDLVPRLLFLGCSSLAAAGMARIRCKRSAPFGLPLHLSQAGLQKAVRVRSFATQAFMTFLWKVCGGNETP